MCCRSLSFTQTGRYSAVRRASRGLGRHEQGVVFLWVLSSLGYGKANALEDDRLETIICSTRGFQKERARPGAGRPRGAAREAGGGGTGDSLLWLLREETGAAGRTGRELTGLHNLRAAEPRSCPQWAGTWPRGDEDRSSVARSVRQPSKRGAGAWALAGRVCFWEARPQENWPPALGVL